MLVPIYLYTADSDRVLLSKDAKLSRAGWTKRRIVLYAYAAPEPGTVPIYLYQAGTPDRFMLSTDPNVTAGWTNLGVEFYAYPSEQQGCAAFYGYHRILDKIGWMFTYSCYSDLGNPWVPDGPVFYTVCEPVTWTVYRMVATDCNNKEITAKQASDIFRIYNPNAGTEVHDDQLIGIVRDQQWGNTSRFTTREVEITSPTVDVAATNQGSAATLREQ